MMELLEGEPPYMNFAPIRALFFITTKGVPDLKQPERWSPQLQDFLSLCLTKDYLQRPSARELLKVF